MALANAPFLLYTSDYSEAVNGSILSGSTSIRVSPAGAQSPTVISVQGFLESLTTLVTNFAGTGFLCTNTAGAPFFRTINGGTGIHVTNSNGVAGNLNISQLPLTTPQLVQVSDTVNAVTGNAQSLVFTGSGGIVVTVNDVSTLAYPAQYQISIAGDGSAGTVTSVGLAEGDANSDFTITGSPITSSGVIDIILNTVKINRGGTNITTYSTGDMLYASAANVLSKLTVGTQNSVLRVNSGIPSWTTAPTVSGQILTYNGTTLVWSSAGSGTVTEVEASSDTGLIVAVSSSTTTPTITINLPGNGSGSAPAEGDILCGNSSGSYAPLEIGAAATVLTSDGTTASWQPPAPDVRPSGFVQLATLDTFPLPSTSNVNPAPWFYVESNLITAEAIVSAWMQASYDATQGEILKNGAAGPVEVVVCADGIPTATPALTTGFLIYSANSDDGGSWVGYEVVKY